VDKRKAKGGDAEAEEEEEEEEEQQHDSAVLATARELERRRAYEEERRRVEAAAARRQEVKAWVSSLRHKRVIVRYVHPQPIYLLFNPWNHSTSQRPLFHPLTCS